MPFIPVADTVLAEIRQELFGQRIENTLYFRMVGGSGIAESTGLANDLIVWWTTLLSQFLSLDLTLREVTITDLSTATGYSVTVGAPTPNPTGDIAVPALPGSVAACVSFRTTNRGRSFRGRNYVAGLPENAVEGNTLSPTTRNGIVNSYGGIASTVVSFPWEWVVVSRYSNGAPRVAGTATLVSAVVMTDDFVDSQRRRLTGRGQ